MLVAVVTDRKICPIPFMEQVEKIVAGRPDKLILREKDWEDSVYEAVARECQKLCLREGVELVVNGRPLIAERLNVTCQVPFTETLTPDFWEISVPVGVSIHSPLEAEALRGKKARYLVAGHIYATDCKKGLPPRGLAFLKEVCRRSSQPVLAIGGINEERVPEILAAGTSGLCVMSSMMRAQNPGVLVQRLRAGRKSKKDE